MVVGQANKTAMDVWPVATEFDCELLWVADADDCRDAARDDLGDEHRCIGHGIPFVRVLGRAIEHGTDLKQRAAPGETVETDDLDLDSRRRSGVRGTKAS